ncbi:hypothetical protein PV08_11196 [Exophiala spinifera]|uniref:Uncharacterized protein n=1 Tax=Exophiala spinifera TaxID=91928 RepID=A0A0D2AUQ0_9EURO|nr:uncharacterized protein PV08_11196 [Exophiala spinifera]KIW10235.1 hypothetical protein PV08_11196 [Exophiala spinifera]
MEKQAGIFAATNVIKDDWGAVAFEALVEKYEKEFAAQMVQHRHLAEGWDFSDPDEVEKAVAIRELQHRVVNELLNISRITLPALVLTSIKLLVQIVSATLQSTVSACIDSAQIHLERGTQESGNAYVFRPVVEALDALWRGKKQGAVLFVASASDDFFSNPQSFFAFIFLSSTERWISSTSFTEEPHVVSYHGTLEHPSSDLANRSGHKEKTIRSTTPEIVSSVATRPKH